MKNDLDFIKEKINESGIHAPADMDEDFVLKAIENINPAPTVLPKKSRKKIVAIAASAAAAVLVLTIAVTVVLKAYRFSNGNEDGLRMLSLPGGLSLKQFNSYSDVKDEVTRLRSVNSRNQYYRYDDVIVADGDMAVPEVRFSGGSSGGSRKTASGSGTDSSSHNTTYVQVNGVDEGDVIKTDGKYIYCVEGYPYNVDKIVIFSAEGNNSRRVAEIPVYADKISATADQTDLIYMNFSDYCGVPEIYLKDDRLIAICDYTDTERVEGVISMCRVNVYDISDMAHITLLDSYTQSGSYISSRMIGDKLCLVSSYYPDSDGDVIPVCGNVPEKMPVDCIYGLSNASSESFLVISAYDTLDHTAAAESKAILGAAQDIYCNQNNLYIYATEWTYENRGSLLREYYDYADVEVKSQILKVDLTGGVTFTAYTEVDGTIDNQYALDEYNGNLRVATTSMNSDGRNINNLYVLGENLSKIGSVTGFAENESIQAVRYVGNTAYVITYEQTDPLFVIDLSNPAKPAILGDVQITGFSTMLVPVDENTLLGIGYYTEDSDEIGMDMETREGLKLALFDVSDRANPKVLDSKSYVDYSSGVQNDPKQLVVNPERGDYVIPLNYRHYEDSIDDNGDYNCTDVQAGGMLNFRIRNGKLVEISRYDAGVDAVDRCAYVGDDVYMTYYDDDSHLQLIATPYQND